jgi:hypothetical protein
MSLDVVPSLARFFPDFTAGDSVAPSLFPDFTAGDSAAPSFFFRLVKTNDCFSDSESSETATAAEGEFRVFVDGTVTGASLGLLSLEEEISSEELSNSLEESIAGFSKEAIGFFSVLFIRVL